MGIQLHRLAFMSIPSFVVKLIYGSMGKELLLSGQNVEAKRLVESGFEFSFPDLSLAIADFFRMKN